MAAAANGPGERGDSRAARWLLAPRLVRLAHHDYPDRLLTGWAGGDCSVGPFVTRGSRFFLAPGWGDQQQGGSGMRLRSIGASAAGLMLVTVIGTGCAGGDKGTATRAESAATRAEDAAKRAESAASRVEAAAQRAEAAAEKAERAFGRSTRK